MKQARTLWLVAALLGGCAAFNSPVARTVDGVTTEGRFIEPDAYALYALGALSEARGKWRDALGFYERARDIDGSGPELSTRIAFVACQLKENSVSDQAFTKAERADASYGPLWFERARCRQLRGDLPGAYAAALEAVRLDPNRAEASLLAADLAEARGELAEAFRFRDSLATRAPDSLVVQQNLLGAAERARDSARMQRAHDAIARIAEQRHAEPHGAGIEHALTALQQYDLERAGTEAERLFRADPSNADALVIALAVADLKQDHDAFAELLASAEAPARPASPAVLSTLSAVLSRRVGTQAAASIEARP